MTMMNKPVGIIGTGSFLPDNVVTNFDLEKMVDTNDQWIRERTGIEERRIAPEGMNTSYMATEAAKKAMQMANVTAEEIDMIIFATLTPDMIIPSAACVLQANLGAKNAAAYDLQAACSGFVYGLITAASYISSGIYKKVLVVGAEILSRRVNWNDRQVISLSGDGGFTMMMGEMLTLKQLNLPVKIFVFNNEELSFIAMEMKASGYLDYATDFVNPDFGKLAEAAGIKGVSIHNSSEVDEKIMEALNHNGPVIVNVRVDKQELAMPPKIAYQQAKGFSKYLINAILDGRGTELKEMAKTNWMKYKSLY